MNSALTRTLAVLCIACVYPWSSRWCDAVHVPLGDHAGGWVVHDGVRRD